MLAIIKYLEHPHTSVRTPCPTTLGSYTVGQIASRISKYVDATLRKRLPVYIDNANDHTVGQMQRA